MFVYSILVTLSGVKNLFDNSKHKVVIHRERFVDEKDKQNHMNNIEINNRWMKKHLSSRKDEDRINSYIWCWIYFTSTFTKQMTLRDKVEQFLIDISRVFPGMHCAPLEWVNVM